MTIRAAQPVDRSPPDGGALLERDLDLANGRINVGRDKTDGGMREIDTLPLLREILPSTARRSSEKAPRPGRMTRC